MVIRAGCVPGFVGGPPVFSAGARWEGACPGVESCEPGGGARETPGWSGPGVMNMLVGGLVWLLGGLYDGHAGGCERAVGSYDGHARTLGSCCLIAVDVGAEGRGPFRGAFFWYNAVSQHLLPAGFLTPFRVNGNSVEIIILSFTFAHLCPFRPPFGLLVAPFPVSAFLRFADIFFVFTYLFHSASLKYARVIENPNLWRYENAHYWGELQE